VEFREVCVYFLNPAQHAMKQYTVCTIVHTIGIFRPRRSRASSRVRARVAVASVRRLRCVRCILYSDRSYIYLCIHAYTYIVYIQGLQGYI
jgi:hypothetical protein